MYIFGTAIGALLDMPFDECSLSLAKHVIRYENY